jgi:hypothetical protein
VVTAVSSWLGGQAVFLAAGPPPEPNTPIVLALDFLVGFIPAFVTVSITFGQPVGIYQRFVRVLAAQCLVIGLLAAPVVVVTGATEPGQWPKSVALGVGFAGGIVWSGRRAYRQRSLPRPDLKLRRWFRPLDYLIGCTYYLVFAFALANVAANPPGTDLPSRVSWFIGGFVMTQVTINVLFRIINRSLEQDYDATFTSHYLLAGLPVVVSVVIYVVAGASPAGPAWRAMLLVAAWRYTTQRPTSTMKTLRALRERRPVQSRRV